MPTTDLCESYPVTDGLISQGNVVRNYRWIDKKGHHRRFCELAANDHRYAFVAYGSITCLTCQNEGLELGELQRDLGAKGLVAMQLLVDVGTVEQLQDWPGAVFDYELGFVEPNPEQIMDDCQEADDCKFAHVLPHHFIVDLSDMTVAAPNCHYYTEKEWLGCLEPFFPSLSDD